MGRTADTLWMIAEEPTVFEIRFVGPVYSSHGGRSSWTATASRTATGLMQPHRGKYKRDERGQIIEYDAEAYFMPSVTMTVGARLFPAGSAEYYEASVVFAYPDHTKLLLKLVKGRD